MIHPTSNMLERCQHAQVDGAQRQVAFSPVLHECLIPRSADISDEDKDAMWFTEKENAGMQMDSLKTIKYMRKGGIENEKITFRGLEHMRSKEMLEQRKINKDVVYGAVLEEQERQRRIGRCDPEEIANASSLHSRWARQKAHRFGTADAEAVEILSGIDLKGNMLSSSISAPPTAQSERDNCLSILEQALQVTNMGPSAIKREGVVSGNLSSSTAISSSGIKRNPFASPLVNCSSEETPKRNALFDASGGTRTHLVDIGLSKKSSTLSKCGLAGKMSSPGAMPNLLSMMRTQFNFREESGVLSNTAC